MKLATWCRGCYGMARFTGEPRLRAAVLAIDHRWRRGYRPVGRWRR